MVVHSDILRQERKDSEREKKERRRERGTTSGAGTKGGALAGLGRENRQRGVEGWNVIRMLSQGVVSST